MGNALSHFESRKTVREVVAGLARVQPNLRPTSEFWRIRPQALPHSSAPVGLSHAEYRRHLGCGWPRQLTAGPSCVSSGAIASWKPASRSSIRVGQHARAPHSMRSTSCRIGTHAGTVSTRGLALRQPSSSRRAALRGLAVKQLIWLRRHLHPSSCLWTMTAVQRDVLCPRPHDARTIARPFLFQ